MQVELRIHELDEVVDGEELGAHAGLVAEEVVFLLLSDEFNDFLVRGGGYHSVHKPDECPESDGVVLHDSVKRSEEIAHALYVAQVGVVFVVGQEHVFHLFHVDVRACICEWRVGVRMGDVFSCKQWNRAVCPVDIFFC